MRILVVCAAGASSTFVATRLRQAAAHRGVPVQASAGSESSLGTDLNSADVLLVGPHLRARLSDIRQQARTRGVRVILLPDDVFTDRDGVRTLALVTSEMDETEAAAAASATRGDPSLS